MTTCDDPRYQLIRLVPVDMATKALSCRCSETKRLPGDKEHKEQNKLREFIYKNSGYDTTRMCVCAHCRWGAKADGAKEK